MEEHQAAIYNKNTTVIRWLLEWGAEYESETILRTALATKHPEIIEVIHLSYGYSRIFLIKSSRSLSSRTTNKCYIRVFYGLHIKKMSSSF